MTARGDLRVEWREAIPNLTEESGFELVWQHLGHTGANPFRVNTPSHALWTARMQERLERQAAELARSERGRTQRWMDQYKPLQVTPRSGSKRRLEQTVLKLPFDNLHDIKLRLERTCIFIGSELYFVMDIRQLDNDYVLLVTGRDGKSCTISYNSPHIDLRSPEPQYIMFNRAPVFLTRIPARSQKQGINNENTVGMSVWPRRSIRVCDDIAALTTGITNETLSWSPHFEALLKTGAVPSLRLSKDVAVYSNGKETRVDFRNRYLGGLDEDTVSITNRDAARPWVLNALMGVGLRTKEV